MEMKMPDAVPAPIADIVSDIITMRFVKLIQNVQAEFLKKKNLSCLPGAE
jgi:hypothetical protein